MRNDTSIENSINNAAFSLEMEGFTIDEQVKAWCRKLLKNEITMEEYISLAKKWCNNITKEIHSLTAMDLCFVIYLDFRLEK